MGGCCCCLAPNDAPNRRGAAIMRQNNDFCPPLAADPFSSSRGTSSFRASGLSDASLEQSVQDIYRALPAPLPYDSDLASSVSSHGGSQRRDSKCFVHQTNSQLDGETFRVDAKELGLSEDKLVNGHDSLVGGGEDEAWKPDGNLSNLIADMDDCPICLEEYDDENPRTITSCEHHFHLSCIFQWMERSDTCPICDQEIVIIDHEDAFG